MQPTILAGRYRIGHAIGTGGMGSVYLAHDERLGRSVAVKVLRSDLAADPQARRRFLAEAQIAAQVVHPNIVRTYDFGDDPAGPFLVQELLQGRTLDEAMPLPPPRALLVAEGIGGALGALHDQGYVHCDVKPQNIWLRPNDHPVLLDFGIARIEGTSTTTLIATPQYLAPERIDGSPPTAGGDLYALGIVLYQIITGRVPFDAPDLHTILAAQRTTPVPPLGIIDPLARPLDAVIARLTAKDPADRYSTAATLQSDLATLRQGRVLDAVRQAAPVAEATTKSMPGIRAGVVAPPPPTVAPPVPVVAAPLRRRRTQVPRWLPFVLIPLLLLLAFALLRGRTSAGQLPVPTTPTSVTTLPEQSDVVPVATLVPFSPMTATPAIVIPAPTLVSDTAVEPVNLPPVVEDGDDDDSDDDEDADKGNSKDKEKDKGKDKD